ncbi:Phage tail assembly chaperone protein, E, or 41 or 14 [Pseudomonas sp. IT-P171]|uniref:phage tail assembly protein n=1 Tax=Pseudomonas sp. IT-P171 TaxID=3026453 RepID=UPI0039E19138
MTLDTQALPAWLAVTEEGVTVTLRYKASFNGVLVDKLTMRAPSVKEFNAAKMIGAGDMEKMELHLFCSLLSVAEADLLALKLKDYNRLQAGYFRLVEEDDV